MHIFEIPINFMEGDDAMILTMDNVHLNVAESAAPSSRNMIMHQLVEDGVFSFAGFIQNEVRATTLVLFKMIAKWVGMPPSEQTAITKAFVDQLEEKEYTGWLQEACKVLELPYQDNWEIVERYMPFCYRWNKIPYNNSVAASGVIMLNGETSVPVRDDCIMYNGVDLESMGYIKYDILTVSTLDMLEYFNGLEIDWDDTNDPKVWDAICAGDTDFVFQFSSPGMKSLCINTQPRSIESLAELNALYRPGPIEAGFIEKYTDVKRGKSNLTEEEQIIERALKKVFGDQHCGLMVFQEDVMRVCTECANFNLTEADDIRKAMGKKKTEVLEKWKAPFVDNWKYKNYVSLNDTGHIWGENDSITLEDGSAITLDQLIQKLENGETVNVVIEDEC